MMNRKINICRYKELLELKKNNLLSQDLYFELIGYNASLKSQISYTRKEAYLLLMDKYLNHQIDSYDFRELFLIMTEEDSAAAYKIYSNLHSLENFKFVFVNDSSKISNLITRISILCRDFDAIAYETRDEMAESEIEFYSSVKKHYLKLQQLFSKNNLDYEKLIFRSFKMLTSILVSEILIIFLYIIIAN